MSRRVLLLALLHAYSISCQALEVGDNLCVQGYVMDKFCIDNVQMIDNGKETLKEPFTHSVHCLVDVPICSNSNFEVLTAPTDSTSGTYSRGYRLTENSKQIVLGLARSVGSCSTCVNGYDTSKLENGFRAVLNASIVELSTDNGTGPPLIMVHNQAYPEPSDTDPCKTVFDLTEGVIMSNNPNIKSDDETSETAKGSGAISWRTLSSSTTLLNGLALVLGLASMW